jgi:hypothetical protein
MDAEGGSQESGRGMTDEGARVKAEWSWSSPMAAKGEASYLTLMILLTKLNKAFFCKTKPLGPLQSAHFSSKGSAITHFATQSR